MYTGQQQRRRERPHQPAGADDRQHDSDLYRRGPVLARQHDREQGEAHEHGVDPSRDQGGRAKKAPVPQPAHALGQLRAKTAAYTLAARLLEPAPHKQHPGRGRRIAHGIKHERHRPAEGKQHASKRRTRQHCSVGTRLVLGDRGR